MKPRHHRAQFDLESLCDLLVREFAVLAQHQHLAKPPGQALERVEERSALLAANEVLVRIV